MKNRIPRKLKKKYKKMGYLYGKPPIGFLRIKQNIDPALIDEFRKQWQKQMNDIKNALILTPVHKITFTNLKI
jgi:hypothetical protein